MIKTGLIGLGLSGRVFHLPLLHASDQYQVTALLSRQTELVAELAPQAQCVAGLEQLLDTDIDLVVITAPNQQHFPLAKAALEAGKHVVLEKPYVTNVAEGKALIELAQQKNLVLSVFHNRRWDGDFLTVGELLQQHQLGRLTHFESHFDRFRPQPRNRWRESQEPGAGILYDLGSHLIDQALVLFGQPNTVSATVLAQRVGAEGDDYFHLILDYDHLQVILHASTLTPLPGPRFCLHGDLGSYIKSGLDPQEDQLRDGQVPGAPGWGREPSTHHGKLFDAAGQAQIIPTQPGCYQSYYEALAAAILAGGQNPVPAEQALETIRIIELALESHRRGCRIACKVQA